MPANKPPLGLHVELVNPDGTTSRLDGRGPAKDRATGINFRTKRFDGFADASMTLRRRIDLDYPDLGLLNGINLIGEEGSIAYEGRIGSLPRSLTSSGHAVTIQTQGWMTHARDQTFVECYIDRDLSHWRQMGRQRRINQLGANATRLAGPSVLPDNTGNPAVEIGFQDAWVAPYKPIAEAWWGPYPGVTIGQVVYNQISRSNVNTTDTNWSLYVIIAADDTATYPTSSANLATLTPPQSSTLSGVAANGSLVAGNSALLSLYYGVTPAGTAGQTYNAQFTQLAVIGNHGLTLQGAAPYGVYASDVIRDVCARFAPLLNTANVQATTLPIPHLVFLSETHPYDAFLEVNKYHRWGLECYDNKTLRYAPVDLSDYDWEVRMSDQGVNVDLQGDDVQNLANGVIVRYTDVATGRETRLTPTAFSQLADPNPLNPANINGINEWTTLPLSFPTNQASALAIGQAFLTEFNQAKSPGTITIQGHVKDRAGHWQPGWKVRAGDRIAITDLPNDRPRLVGETDWNHDAKTLRVAVDSSLKRVEAVLDRFGVALQAANLTLP
ncbi:MAG: hypothetical protein NVSMB60_26170 [Mycobacterium sp.]